MHVTIISFGSDAKHACNNEINAQIFMMHE